ncbi:MAG: sigma 54-interacting transcriptional regulator [Deltaproteobacteria bacterium]|nr:sigma 54-interacting transcriptional regulator [Deltaproteobacteria bacterium]
MATVNQVGKRERGRRRQETFGDRYRMLGELPPGGTGEIILVEDLSRGGRCALKLLPAHASAARLRSEFARLSELSHPSIVRVRDAGVLASGRASGRAFVVTEYLAGPTLADCLPLDSPAARFAQFSLAAEALADALAYLHGRGILHGDISPANIRCDEAGRPVLIDFGLAELLQPVSVNTAVAGTLGFIAPEALLGERSPAGDIFALGATLYDAWAGAPPFGLGMDAVKRAWQGPPPAPSSLQAGLPPAWDRILLSMLAAAVQDRPGSARVLLQEIRRELPGRPVAVEEDLAVPCPAGDPFAGVVVGRSDEEAVLRRHLEQLAQGTAPVSLVCVAGVVGSGRHALIRKALREARLAVLAQTIEPFDIREGECSEILGRIAPKTVAKERLSPGEVVGDAQEGLACVLEDLERRSASRPLCLALAGSVEDEALARALAGNPPSGRLLLLLPCQHVVEGAGIAGITLAPLSRAALAELVRRGAGSDAPKDVLDHVVAGSAGLPGVAVLLIRAWLESVHEGKPHAFHVTERERDMARLLDASLSSLSDAARAFLVLNALSLKPSSGGSVAPADVEPARSAEGRQEALAAGWLEFSGTDLPSEAHLAALWRLLAGDVRLHGLAQKAAGRLPAGDSRLAEVQLALGMRNLAAASFWQAMRAAATRMAWSKVAEYGVRAWREGGSHPLFADALLLANALGILGRYDEALQVLDACDAQKTADAQARIAERKAWLLGRHGDPEAARRLLEAALAVLPANGDEALLLRSRLARMLVAAGRYGEAFAAAQPALRVASPAGIPAREAAVLALAYAEKLTAAEEILTSLKARGQEVSDPTLASRVASLEGLIRQLAGQPLSAAEAYRRALRGYERVQDRHGAAVAAFNLGCTLAEIGDYGGAITALERAIRELGRLDAVTDHALAVFNVGQLFLQLGDLEAAARALVRLEEDAKAARVEAFAGQAHLLAAEIARRRSDLGESGRRYAEAAKRFFGVGMQTMAAIAQLGRAEILAEQGAAAEARALLAEIEAGGVRLSPSGTKSATPMAESFALASARVALCDAGTSDADGVRLAEALGRFAEGARTVGRLPAAWRAATLAASLFLRARDARGDASRELAQRIFEEVKMKAPAKYRPGMDNDADAKSLSRPAAESEVRAVWGQRAALLESRLRRLLRINKRLNSDLRVSRVLETIIDTVIELTDAERGFLLLKDGNGELAVKVARNIDQSTLEGPSLSLSRTIAKQAADTGEPVITVDAAGDSRFAEHVSVSDLHLRSVLAVPLSVKGTVVGTIYVDHRLRKGVFGEDELAMVLDFAEQGAIAIENARVISELRRREQQVQSLNRRLARELRVQEAALSDARVELKESRQAAALRYDYRQIVGQSPAMLDLFRLLDRVTDTNLPVVIEGESGTGKELVARAIHFHGPRKDKPFVSENCAAIPETLLESALFGHVRGAFTGADREARGLFAVANGGTLFLDEVADMSPAMQGKLLRVLQDGEFHRVGGERAEKADVRLLVASNRNLSQLVEEGKFRKDLFYRLSVVRLHLPPLRERREDIPLLLRHFLEKASAPAGAAPKRIVAAALARLCGYAWPGNVRELENEIARAAAFAGPTIEVADLAPHIQSGQDPSETIRNEPDSLRLRQRVERLERQIIREAMNRAQGNQTRAALLLGLSRFGLQKKLRRYNLGS